MTDATRVFAKRDALNGERGGRLGSWPPSRYSVSVWAGRIVLVGAMLAAWQWILPEMAGSTAFASASDSFRAAGRLVVDGEALPAVLSTVPLFALSLGVGTVTAVVVALVLYRGPRLVASTVEPFFAAFYAMPRVALIPLLALQFGRGATTTIIFAGSTAFTYQLFWIRAALVQSDTEVQDAVRLMGASASRVVRTVMIPQISYALFAGLVVAGPITFAAVIAVELIVGTGGFGDLLNSAYNSFNSSEVFGAIILATVVAFMLEALFRWTDRRLSARGEGTAVVGRSGATPPA